MNELLGILKQLLGQAAFGILLILFVAGLTVYVKTQNYRRLVAKAFGAPMQVDTLDDEDVFDRIDVIGPLLSTRNVLTNRQITQLRVSWWMSKQAQVSLGLVDVHSIAFRRGMRWFLAVAAVMLLSGGSHPLGYLVALAALELRRSWVTFGTPFALMPLTRIVIASPWPAQAIPVRRFFANAQALWARIRAERELSRAPVSVESVEGSFASDFHFGTPVWGVTVGLMGVAFVQRLVGGHVLVDTVPVGAIYVAAPAILGRYSRRNGAWGALLGLVGLLTVKYPGTGIAGFFVNDGGVPDFGGYILFLFTLLAVSEAANACSRANVRWAASLTPILWLIYPLLTMAGASLDFALLAQTAVAVWISAVGSMVVDRVSRNHGPGRPA